MITYMYVYTYMGTILFLMKAWGSPIRYYRNSKIFSRLQLWGQKLSKVKQPLSLNSNKISSHSWSLPCFDMVAQAARHCRSKDVSNICSWRKSTCILAEDWCTLCKFHCSIIWPTHTCLVSWHAQWSFSFKLETCIKTLDDMTRKDNHRDFLWFSSRKLMEQTIRLVNYQFIQSSVTNFIVGIHGDDPNSSPPFSNHHFSAHPGPTTSQQAQGKHCKVSLDCKP